jgi:hypothetical protein
MFTSTNLRARIVRSIIRLQEDGKRRLDPKTPKYTKEDLLGKDVFALMDIIDDEFFWEGSS